MGKIPTDRPATHSARYNPMDRPSTSRAAPAGERARISPASPAAPGAGGGDASPSPRPPAADSPLSHLMWHLGSDGGHMSPPAFLPATPLASLAESPSPRQPAPDDSLPFLTWHLGPEGAIGDSIPATPSLPGTPSFSTTPSLMGSPPMEAPGREASATPSHPGSPSDPADTESPGTRYLLGLMNPEPGTRPVRSQWNGYKLMDPHLTDAIRYCDRTFPPNLDGVAGGNPRERSMVFHDTGGSSAAPERGRVAPRRMNVGDEGGVEIPEDLRAPTARVFVHTHPYTGRHYHNEPSLADQLVARRNPHAAHIVQIPAPDPGEGNPYLIYSGAVPPRHYTLVDNPGNLPVSPPSPDGDAFPDFRPHPGNRN